MVSFLVLAAVAFTAQAAPPNVGPATDPGSLRIIDSNGKEGLACPLQGTQVGASIEGFGARVVVLQTFTNPSAKAIEAIYTFPLPQDSAVDGMRMIIGNRVIEGVIKKRDEARATYEQAKREGKSTALLDQERPNIFTQSVANIPPHAKIRVAITYVQILKFEEDQFEFVFPMVVGHRYAGATTPDPHKVVPNIVPQGTRSGSTIRLTVDLDAGAPITDLHTVLHKVNVDRPSASRARVTLAHEDEIPNRDFILRYSVATNTVASSLLTHADGNRGGFFTLILMPPKAPSVDQVAPKEAIFVIDQSGSQQGFPLEKSKELTIKAIKALNPNDTFNIVNFSNDFRTLWDAPRPNTPENRDEAIAYVQPLQAIGGTELEKAVVAALSPPPDKRRPRVVIFNTDGFIGGEAKALEEIARHRGNARMFTFGIGNSVNRYLIEGMALEGRGDYEVVTLNADSDAAVDRLVRRTDSPILTDIKVEFEGVDVHDTLPEYIPDVFSEKPVIIKGRYDRPGRGVLVVSGNLGGKPWQHRYPINFPAEGNAGSAIATLWAREKVNDLEVHQRMETARGATASAHDAKFWEDAITKLALQYSIMTKFTSFVAVDHAIVNPGGIQQTIRVPVEMADGVSYDGIFGKTLSGGKLRRKDIPEEAKHAQEAVARLSGAPGGAKATFAARRDVRLAKNALPATFGGGDPLLTVEAPSDATVVAIFPEGDVKPLKWNSQTSQWEVRFDIPLTIKEATYSVKVRILNADGSRKTLDVPFAVSMTAPDLIPTSTALGEGYVRIQVPPNPQWARVVLMTPWGDRLDFVFDPMSNTIRVNFSLPADFKGGWFKVFGVDRAHNERSVRMLLNAKGEVEKIEPVR